MKLTIPIEDVQIGDTIDGLEVVNILHRDSANYVRLTLAGGWPIVDGHKKDRKVTVKRKKRHINA